MLPTTRLRLYQTTVEAKNPRMYWTEQGHVLLDLWIHDKMNDGWMPIRFFGFRVLVLCMLGYVNNNSNIILKVNIRQFLATAPWELKINLWAHLDRYTDQANLSIYTFTAITQDRPYLSHVVFNLFTQVWCVVFKRMQVKCKDNIKLRNWNILLSREYIFLNR